MHKASVMAIAKVTLQGAIFEKGREQHLRNAVNRALDDTSKWGRGLIQSRTPVRTGNLKNNFYISGQSNFVRTIENQTPYYVFVEARVQMVGRSVSEIDRYLEVRLNREIFDRFS